jgi:hypothetical protein
MLHLKAHNKTGTKPDGTSDYDVEVSINSRVIFGRHITGHIRADGAADLLRLIADAMDGKEYVPTTCLDCGKRTKAGRGSARCPECWEDRTGHVVD